MKKPIVETLMALAFVALLVAYGVNWPAPEQPPLVEGNVPDARPEIWWQR